MEQFLNIQIDYLLMLQHFREMTNGVLNPFFMFITSLGEISIPTLLIAVFYWCIDSKCGMYIMWNWSLGQFICQFFKSLACIYRPWVLDSRVVPIEGSMKMAGGYSFPSGHTQAAVGIWGALAYYLKNKFLTPIVVILILLIAFSRNYIGVHTPQDVIVSLFVGVFVLIFSEKLMTWVEKGKNRDTAVLAAVISASVALVIYEYTKTYPMDYVNGKLLVDPFKMQVYTFPKIGLLNGIFLGWFLNRRFIHFEGAEGNVKQKVARGIIGLLVLLSMNKEIHSLFDDYGSKRLMMFTTSFISSMFISCIYPAIVCYKRKKIR